VAFTAASTMKIPIMLSVLRRIPEPTRLAHQLVTAKVHSN